MADLVEQLRTEGFRVASLSRPEASRAFAAWCAAFLEDVRRTTGAYRYRGLHWHAFSYGLVTAREGKAALDGYASLPVTAVTVVPEDWSRGCGVRCEGEVLPDLSGLRHDLYVFPASLAWSMAFTHEQSRCGPYLVLRDDLGTEGNAR